MALTLPQLAYRLRIQADDTTAVSTEIATELADLRSVASAFIALQAPAAPGPVQDEATVLFAAYVYDGPSSDPGGAALAYPNAWRNSGAEALLARWRVRRAGIIAPAGAAAVAAAAAAGNPVVGARVDEGDLVFTLADGATISVTLPSGGGNGDGGAGLTVEQAADLAGAVQYAGLTLSDRDLSVADSEGNVKTLTIPGITVRDESLVLGNANGVVQLSFVGPNVAAVRNGDQVTVTITGVSVAEVNTLVAAHESVGDLERFEAALRYENNLVTGASVTIGLSNAAGQIPGHPTVPPSTFDRQLVFRQGTGLHQRFTVGDLLAKPSVTDSQQLDDGNSLSWRESDVTFRVARERGTNRFLFSADTPSTYLLTITDSQVDVQGWARLSSAARMPAAKLPAQIPAGNLPAAALAGRSEAQVSAAIRAAVRDFAETGNDARVPDGNLSNKADDLLSAFNDSSGWVREGTAPADDAMLRNVSASHVGQPQPTLAQLQAQTVWRGTADNPGGTTYLNIWVAVRVPAAINADVAAGLLRVGNITNVEPDDPGEQHVSDDGTWVLVGRGTGVNLPYFYYAIRFTGIPGGDSVAVSRFARFSFDRRKLEIDYSQLTGTPPLPVGTVQLHNGPLTGLAVTSSAGSVETAIGSGAITPAFDLDDHTHGEFHVSITLGMTSRSDNAISFDSTERGTTASVTTYTFSAIEFLSQVKALASWQAGGTIEGVVIAGKVDVYRQGVKLGDVAVYLVHDGTNRLAYIIRYEGASGRYTWSFTASMRLSYSASDGGASSGGGGGASPTVSSVILNFATAQIDGVTFDRYHTPVVTSGVPAQNKIISMWYTGPFSSVAVRLGRPPSGGNLWRPVPEPGGSTGTYEWKYARNLRAEFTGGGIRLTQTASTDGGNINSRGSRRLYIEYLA